MKKRIVATSEYEAVTNIVAQYVEAIQTGSITMLKETFYKDSITYGFVDDKLMGGGTSNPAVDFIKEHGESPNMAAHIDVLDITPATAIVRVATGNDAIGSDCDEYLTLLKLASGWTIIAKVFYQFEM